MYIGKFGAPGVSTAWFFCNE